MFIDYAKIFIKSGKGGDGHISFRRELYVPNGGPNGGDGGKGGDVIIHIDNNMNTLLSFKHQKKYQAENGEDGNKNRCHGKDGKDLIINVPNGTIIRDLNTNKIIIDMTDREDFVILKGGKGGIGNMHFATSKMQAPRYAKPGGPALELEIVLELKLLADVSLVGFPNVGKSTLISMVSNARPEINNYHFTTINPHLGVVKVNDKEFLMVDVPGLIEGAATGAGLGFRFLRHIERTKIILHMVDITGLEGRDPLSDVDIIMNELKKYSDNLSNKNQIFVFNKIDSIDEETLNLNIEKIIKKYKEIKYFKISAITKTGIKELLQYIANLLTELKDDKQVYDSEIDIENIFKENDEDIIINKINDKTYEIKGEKIKKMLGYTNLEDEKGLAFLQKFLKDLGIIDMLKDKGLKDYDTIDIYGFEFEYVE